MMRLRVSADRLLTDEYDNPNSSPRGDGYTFMSALTERDGRLRRSGGLLHVSKSPRDSIKCDFAALKKEIRYYQVRSALYNGLTS